MEKTYAERVWILRWNFISKTGDVISLQDTFKCTDNEDFQVIYVLNDNYTHEDIAAQEAINLAIDEYCLLHNIACSAFAENNCNIY